MNTGGSHGEMGAERKTSGWNSQIRRRKIAHGETKRLRRRSRINKKKKKKRSQEIEKQLGKQPRNRLLTSFTAYTARWNEMLFGTLFLEYGGWLKCQLINSRKIQSAKSAPDHTSNHILHPWKAISTPIWKLPELHNSSPHEFLILLKWCKSDNQSKHFTPLCFPLI